MDLYNRAKQNVGSGAGPSSENFDVESLSPALPAPGLVKDQFYNNAKGFVTDTSIANNVGGSGSGAPPSSSFCSRRLTALFCILFFAWTVLLVQMSLGEFLVFYFHVASCLPSSSLSTETQNLIIVSDPQLTNFYSYETNFGIFEPLLEYYSDIYMRRYFQLFQKQIRLDGAVFLGDLFDGVTNYMHHDFSRATFSDAEYVALNARWNWVFEVTDREDRDDFEIFNVAGNHDVGFNIDRNQQKELIVKYKEHFGALNYKKEFGGFDIYVVADTLMHSTMTLTSAFNETNRFLDSANTCVKVNPRVLFTHVPMLRDPSSFCGEENPKFHMPLGMGYSYTNMLSQDDTNRILSTIKPDFVFTGDQHNLCHFKRVQNGSIIEDYVMNAFSWMQGQLYPGAAVLHFFPQHASGRPRLAVSVCPMHNQLRIYSFYGIAAIITFLVFLVAPRRIVDADSPKPSGMLEALRYRIATFFLFLFICLVFYVMLHILLY